MLLAVLLAFSPAAAADLPWAACGDWLGPAWFVVARPDTGHGRAYGTFRCQSLDFGGLPCRSAVAVGRLEVDQLMSNGLLFYGLQVRTTGTTEGILAFVDGRGGGAAYHPAEASWGPTPPKALLTGWLADERAHGRLASGLEVHTWQCAGGTDLGDLDLSALGLVHVPHAVAP